jgi:transcription termination factor Rho
MNSKNNSRSFSRNRHRRRGDHGGRPEGAPNEQDAPAYDHAEAGGEQPGAANPPGAPANGAPPEAPAGDPALKVPADKVVVIGITGEPGAGKSALARQLVGLGAQLVVLDEIGHELIETPPVKKSLAKEFGEDIIGENGEIDRRKLAAKAFASAEATAKLNAIVHPKLSARAKAVVKKAGNFVVIDGALLHELGLGELCTTSIYVRAPREARLARVADRGWDEAELSRREAALGDADARRKACNLAVDNSGDPALLAAYAKTILARQLGVDLVALRKSRQTVEAPQASDDGEEGPGGDDGIEGAARPGEEARTADGRHDPRAHDPRGPRDNRDFARGGPDGHRPHQGQGGNDRPPLAERPPQPGERPPVKVDLDDYLRRILPDLQGEADRLEVRDVKWLKKHDLICEILRRVAGGRSDEILIEGYVELVKGEQAYIRSALNNYLPVSTDTFIANPQIRRYGLKAGMHVTGTARSPRGNERCPQLLAVHTVMGEPENKRTAVQDFEHLIPLHAHDRLFMELPNDPSDYSLRIIDLVSPIGKGQRGLIVAQPKCGKTVYMQKISKAIATNNPEVVLIVLLVDERPEEVTDMQRSVRGEVVASTFDQPASRHVQCAEMVINKAKRLVERGKDVVVLLDSITRLARAYNTEAPNSGRILSGGIDSNALIKPKQFFGAARKIENGGSLTILATAIVDTGSLMDTVIFEEFKGTGNMELVLDRRLANRRVFPAVDCAQSGTRKDELLIKNDDELRRVWALRKFLAERNGADAIDFLKSKLKNSKTNIEFLLTIDPDKLSSW